MTRATRPREVRDLLLLVASREKGCGIEGVESKRHYDEFFSRKCQSGVAGMLEPWPLHRCRRMKAGTWVITFRYDVGAEVKVKIAVISRGLRLAAVCYLTFVILYSKY